MALEDVGGLYTEDFDCAACPFEGTGSGGVFYFSFENAELVI